MFPRLRLKHKPNLISLAGGMGGLPVTDPAARATPLAPSDWKAMLAGAVRVQPGGQAQPQQEQVRRGKGPLCAEQGARATACGARPLAAYALRRWTLHLRMWLLRGSHH